jgi:hypothetical protein
MLLPREQSPWNCGYYLGAIALDALNKKKDGKSDLPELQRSMSELSKREISATQVVAATAWLFLIDAIDLDANGNIRKCV